MALHFLKRALSRAGIGLDAIRVRLSGWKSAVRELAIIVVGVLLALGAQAQWEKREERQRERDYLAQLQADAATNLQLITAEQQRNSTAARRTVELYRLLRTQDQLPTNDSVARLLAVGGLGLQLRTGVLDALIRTGDIRLVRNDSLRATLVGHYADLQRLVELMRLLEDILARNSDARSAALERHSSPGEPGGRSGLTTRPDFAALRDDSEYRSTVRRRAEIYNAYENLLSARREPIQVLVRLLDAELRRQ